MKLSIAAIVKDEADTLLEWLAFHRAVGVDSFFIADNDSTDGTTELLEALSAHGFLQRLHVPTPRDGNAQMPAYAALLSLARGHCDVLAFIDADEYLLPMDGSPSLRPLVERLFDNSEVGAVGLNWANFGSSGALFADDGMVIERFTKRAPQPFGVHYHIKTLVRPTCTVGFANPHWARLATGRYVDATGGDIVPHPKHGKGLSNRIVWEGARVNHYATKSLEEFLVGKSRRGSASKKTRVKHQSYFVRHDRNDEDCLLAVRLADAARNEANRLRALLEAPCSANKTPNRWYELAARIFPDRHRDREN